MKQFCCLHAIAAYNEITDETPAFIILYSGSANQGGHVIAEWQPAKPTFM